jgi:hypothetical protein
MEREMRIISWHLETGIVGGDREGEIEVDHDTTDDEIEVAVKEDMWNFLSLTWREKASGSAPT